MKKKTEVRLNSEEENEIERQRWEEMGFGEVEEEKWERTAVAAVTLGRRHRRPEERTEKEEKGEDDDFDKWGGGSRTAKHKEEG